MRLKESYVKCKQPQLIRYPGHKLVVGLKKYAIVTAAEVKYSTTDDKLAHI